jgi:hypothetical protein
MGGAKSMNRGVRRCLAIHLCIAIVVSGCATTPPRLSAPLLPVDTWAKLGTIGVVTEHALPDFMYRIPTAEGKLVGALKGAGAGVLAAPVGSCSGDFCGAALLVYLAVAVSLGAVIGGTVGAARAVSAEEVRKAEAGLQNIMTELRIQQGMQDEFLELARAKTSHTFVDIETAFSPRRIDSETEAGVNYHTLSEAGIDSLIRIGVRSLVLTAPTTEKNPSLNFMAMANIKVVKTSDDNDVYDNDVSCSGDSHRFTTWAADGGSLLKKELIRCYANIANQAVDLLLLRQPSPSKEQQGVGPVALGGGAPTHRTAPKGERPTYSLGQRWDRSDGEFTLVRIKSDRYVFLSDAGHEIHLTKDLMVAKMQKGGWRTEFDPPPTLPWPLVVGSWGTGTGTWQVPLDPAKLPVKYTWSVEAYENVRVPAGTFKAIRIVLSWSPQTQGVLRLYSEERLVIWYAPEIRQLIKAESQYSTPLSFQIVTADRTAIEAPVKEAPGVQPASTESATPRAAVTPARGEMRLSLEEQLHTLKTLRERNLITEEHYQEATRDLLKKMTE